MSYEELKRQVCDLIDLAAQDATNITVITLAETPKDE